MCLNSEGKRAKAGLWKRMNKKEAEWRGCAVEDLTSEQQWGGADSIGGGPRCGENAGKSELYCAIKRFINDSYKSH